MSNARDGNVVATEDAGDPRDPREPGTYTNLATLELQSGNRARAIRYFAENVGLDPIAAESEIDRWTKRSEHPLVFYFHVWELDPDQPRISGVAVMASQVFWNHMRM